MLGDSDYNAQLGTNETNDYRLTDDLAFSFRGKSIELRTPDNALRGSFAVNNSNNL